MLEDIRTTLNTYRESVIDIPTIDIVVLASYAIVLCDDDIYIIENGEYVYTASNENLKNLESLCLYTNDSFIIKTKCNDFYLCSYTNNTINSNKIINTQNISHITHAGNRFLRISDDDIVTINSSNEFEAIARNSQHYTLLQHNIYSYNIEFGTISINTLDLITYLCYDRYTIELSFTLKKINKCWIYKDESNGAVTSISFIIIGLTTNNEFFTLEAIITATDFSIVNEEVISSEHPLYGYELLISTKTCTVVSNYDTVIYSFKTNTGNSQYVFKLGVEYIHNAIPISLSTYGINIVYGISNKTLQIKSIPHRLESTIQ
jgi:hypothetical protein